MAKPSGRTRLTIILLVVTALALLTVDGRGSGPAATVRNAIGSVFAPIGDVAGGIVRPVRNVWNGAFSDSDFEKENEQLRQEVEKLQGEVIANEVAKSQLQQLLELVGIPFVGEIPRVHAGVISGSVGNFGNTIEIDRGANSGIKRDQPVITGKGLVGRVIEVSDSRAKVMLITSNNFNVGFSVVGTSAVGVAKGQGNNDTINGSNLDSRQKVQVGQIAVTSGLGDSVYPPNLPIGTITEVRNNAAMLESMVTIRLFASTTDLTYVDVLQWEKPK